MNLKCISPRQHSSTRMSSVHQRGAALRPWLQPPSPSVSEFTMLLGKVCSAPLQSFRALKRQVDICSSRPCRPSSRSRKSLWPPTTSLSFGRANLHFFFLRTFLHSSIFSAFIAFCRLTAPVTRPSLSAPVAPPSSEKSSCPRRCTSTHSLRRFPRSST